MYNTKLNQDQKAALKVFRNEQPSVKVVTDKMWTTIAYRDMGNTVEFAVATMSPQEKKFRPKVGEFYVRARMYEGATISMNSFYFYEILDRVLGI